METSLAVQQDKVLDRDCQSVALGNSLSPRLSLSTLRERMPHLRWSDFRELEITQVTTDSRRVQPGSLFLAIAGTNRDGHCFVAEALDRGAVAIVGQHRLTLSRPMPQAVSDQLRRDVARISSLFWGQPTQSLQIVGITGTNGKTTTAHLLHSIFSAAGRPAGMLGTIAYIYGGHRIPASHTTPESLELDAHFARMVDAGVSQVAMEVSSHSLDQERVSEIPFAGAIFTNFSQDHLDYHKTMEQYRQAKARLFALLPAGHPAALNADDPACEFFASHCHGPVYTYGLQKSATVRAREVQLDDRHTRFEVVFPGGRLRLRSSLVGMHNVSNILAAFTCAFSLGIPLAQMEKGIESLTRVPGRLESIDSGQPFSVFVDYAHTPEALRRILEYLRRIKSGDATGSPTGRLLLVFGCGGDRDRGKRPQMGRIAEELADRLWLTSDNPRSEEPLAILREIEAGLCLRTKHRLCPERAEAIGQALAEARRGDLVLIAGKGHEDYQIFADRTIHFDDREVARQSLAALGYKI